MVNARVSSTMTLRSLNASAQRLVATGELPTAVLDLLLRSPAEPNMAFPVARQVTQDLRDE